jgi:hypothetical protein
MLVRSIILVCLCLQRYSEAFSPIGWVVSKPSLNKRTTDPQILAAASNDDSVLDVEFELVQQTEPIEEDKPVGIKPDSEKTLLDLALEANPEFQEIRVPFCDKDQQVINCKLALTAELDGNVYGIGVPFGHAVVVTIEQPDGMVLALDPDDEDNAEILEIMAGALAKYLSKDLKLKKTPSVLTIEGDLDHYTKDWQTEILGKPIDAATLVDDSDDSMESFFAFMKDELGEDEFQQTMDEDFDMNDVDDIDPSLREFFEVAGLGTAAGDLEGMEEIMTGLMSLDDASLDKSSLEESLEAPFKAISTDLEHNGIALKLVGFNFRNGNIYSLVKPLKAYTLVGKMSDDDGLRFNLLTKEESKLVIPRLQDVCRADLKKAGLDLPARSIRE